MSEQTVRLMQLIQEEKTCNEICLELGISNKQLFSNLTNLRNKGLFYKRRYYSNGAILYRPIKTVSDLKKCQRNFEFSIFTEHSEKDFRSLVISDLHFGNTLERLDLLNRVYDYCIQSGIHIIFCCGDLIDGAFTQGDQSIGNIYDQIEHFVKDYPFDKHILTFAIGGDHDVSGLSYGGQDIVEMIRNYRHDIVIGGYQYSSIAIKNDFLTLAHKIDDCKFQTNKSSIILQGHTHQYGTMMLGKTLKVKVPSLSNVYSPFPSALELNIHFEKGYMQSAGLKQIYFQDKDYVLSNVTYDLLDVSKVKGRNIGCEVEVCPEVGALSPKGGKVKSL